MVISRVLSVGYTSGYPQQTPKERYDMIIKYRDIARENLLKAQKVLEYAECKAKYYEDIINGLTYDNSNSSTWKKSELDCRK